MYNPRQSPPKRRKGGEKMEIKKIRPKDIVEGYYYLIAVATEKKPYKTTYRALTALDAILYLKTIKITCQGNVTVSVYILE